MKIIICDVGNAACAFITSHNGYTMMIDCGDSCDKKNPVDVFKTHKEWLGSKDFYTSNGHSFPITLLHITHPDLDHVSNASRVIRDIPPRLVEKTKFELFSDGDSVDESYKQLIDLAYRTPVTEIIPWGFQVNKTWRIPMSICKFNDELCEKERNNSSIIRYLKDDGIGVLFCGDLERPGWDYLVANDNDFVDTIRNNGIDIMIAPHHGHKSGFPKALFDIIENVDIVIHSKDTEASKDGTDVSNQYSSHALGHVYTNLSNREHYIAKVLTTRSNGTIFIETKGNGYYNVWTDKASPNHEKLQ